MRPGSLMTEEAASAQGRSSSRARILIFYDHPEEFIAELEVRYPQAEFFTCRTYEELPRSLASVMPSVVLAFKFEPKPFPRETILSCPTLKWLSVGFAGVDHVVPWDEARVVVTNAAGVAAREMAHYALAAVFGMFQEFPSFFRDQTARRWNYHLIRPARDATIGLVGLGHTGSEIARVFRALGHRVLACRARPAPSANVDAVYALDQLNEMLGMVDATIVCTALTPLTRELFDGARFAAMKRGSFFVNISRGAVVQEDALLQALKDGQLGGAVLDVVRSEPLREDSLLWDAPNLLITPHTSSEYQGWFRDAALLFADNLGRWLAGKPLLNRVSSERGY